MTDVVELRWSITMPMDVSEITAVRLSAEGGVVRLFVAKG